jgi:hypothetical protein
MVSYSMLGRTIFDSVQQTFDCSQSVFTGRLNVCIFIDEVNRSFRRGPSAINDGGAASRSGNF